MTYKLGIDVGSTTLKAILLNEQDEIIYKAMNAINHGYVK